MISFVCMLCVQNYLKIRNFTHTLLHQMTQTNKHTQKHTHYETDYETHTMTHTMLNTHKHMCMCHYVQFITKCVCYCVFLCDILQIKRLKYTVMS